MRWLSAILVGLLLLVGVVGCSGDAQTIEELAIKYFGEPKDENSPGAAEVKVTNDILHVVYRHALVSNPDKEVHFKVMDFFGEVYENGKYHNINTVTVTVYLPYENTGWQQAYAITMTRDTAVKIDWKKFPWKQLPELADQYSKSRR